MSAQINCQTMNGHIAGLASSQLETHPSKASHILYQAATVMAIVLFLVSF